MEFNNLLWKQLPNAPHILVSNTGVIYNKYKEYEIPQHFTGGSQKRRYARVSIKDYGLIYVHQAVALAHLEPVLGMPVVHHINGNHLDNRLENLQWATQQENVRAAQRVARCRPRLLECEVKAIKEMIASHADQLICNKFDIGHMTLWRIKNNITYGGKI